MSEKFPLPKAELEAMIAKGEIDTVVVAMTDMQGRLVGKRLDAKYFLSDVLKHGTEGCNYLLAVDVDMNTVPGYAMSSWDKGYADFAMMPALYAEDDDSHDGAAAQHAPGHGQRQERHRALSGHRHGLRPSRLEGGRQDQLGAAAQDPCAGARRSCKSPVMPCAARRVR